MKQWIAYPLGVLFCLVVWTPSLSAQTNNNHYQVGLSVLYERGLDATVAYEHSTRYHNAWEYFATYYIKYEKDPLSGHYTTDSFWNSYRSWHVGICYKPCVSRGRNHHGNVRIGASVGSDTDRFLGGIHAGYEHSYALYKGWEIYYQVKVDMLLPDRKDLFRTGVSLGVKIP